MSWLKRAFGRAAPAENLDAMSCSFCRASRREVRKLIAGPDVLICDNCLLLCAHILDDEVHAQEGGSWFGEAILSSVVHQGPLARHARVTPALRAAIELAAGDPARLRRVAAVADEVSDSESALAALRAIPAERRTANDRLSQAAILVGVERHAEALAALDAIDAGAVSGVEAILLDLHRALIELERGELSPARIEAHQARAVELAAAAVALPAGRFEDLVRSERLAVLTLAALARGELEDAERVARRRVAFRPADPSPRELLARVLAARGDDEGARTARAEALAAAHPDGPLARRLGSAGGGPFR